MTIKWSIRTVAALVLVAGCTATDSTGSAQQTDTVGPSAREMHAAPGPEVLLFAALHHLDLRPEQRSAIEQAMQAIGPRHSTDLFVEVAAGVRAGKLDENRVLATLDSGAVDRRAAVTSALETLHATLAADQRRALVDAIGKHVDDHAIAHGPMMAGAGVPEHLVAALNLSSDQRASIDRILATGNAPSTPQEAFHAALSTRLQAFAADRFDASAFATPPKEMRDHIQRTLHAIAAILPELDATQRETLAKMIEARASQGGE
jgi:hypothetical protein